MKNKTVSIVLDEKLLAKLDKIAERNKRSRSSEIEFRLEESLKVV